jgi:hypothetical protein
LIAVVVNIWQTHAQLNVQREENRVTQVANLLKDTSSAIGSVTLQLESQAGMYIEIQDCLSKNKNKREVTCWKNNFSFDPSASAEAWRQLDSTMAYAEAFLVSGKEKGLLAKIRQAKSNQQAGIKDLVPPYNSEEASRLSDIVLNTRQQLSVVQNQLVQLLAARVRSRE